MSRHGQRRGLESLVRRLNRRQRLRRAEKMELRQDLRLSKLFAERAEALRKKAKGDNEALGS